LAEGGDGKRGRVISVEDETNVNIPKWSFRSRVNIEWDYGGTSEYRRGQEGSDNIKCVTAANGEMYYRDHLPKLGNY